MKVASLNGFEDGAKSAGRDLKFPINDCGKPSVRSTIVILSGCDGFNSSARSKPSTGVPLYCMDQPLPDPTRREAGVVISLPLTVAFSTSASTKTTRLGA